jgi:hypothetical protein
LPKKTLQTAKATGNEVIVQVKGNQKTLLNDCQSLSATTPPDEVYQEPVIKTRNRIESRKVEIFISPTLTDTEQWALVKVVVKVQRFRQFLDTKTNTWKNSDDFFLYFDDYPECPRVLSGHPPTLEHRKQKSLCPRCNHGRRQISDSN